MEELAAATMLMYPFSFGTKSYVVASWGTTGLLNVWIIIYS